MTNTPYNKDTASPTDRVAWVLCQIIDDDAPLRWTRYRFAAECIALNPILMADLQEIRRRYPVAQPAQEPEKPPNKANWLDTGVDWTDLSSLKEKP